MTYTVVPLPSPKGAYRALHTGTAVERAPPPVHTAGEEQAYSRARKISTYQIGFMKPTPLTHFPLVPSGQTRCRNSFYLTDPLPPRFFRLRK